MPADADSLPDPPVERPLPRFRHSPHNLMPRNPRIGGSGALHDFGIPMADAASLHADQHLFFARLRNRNFNQLHVPAGNGHLHCFHDRHRILPPVYLFWRTPRKPSPAHHAGKSVSTPGTPLKSRGNVTRKQNFYLPVSLKCLHDPIYLRENRRRTPVFSVPRSEPARRSPRENLPAVFPPRPQG